MFIKIKNWFAARRHPLLPAASTEDGEQIEDAVPRWAEDLIEATQRLSRSNAKLTVKLEDLENKTEAGFSEWRHNANLQNRTASQDTFAAWNEVCDCLDLLDAAIQTSAVSCNPSLAQGLKSISERLTGTFESHGYQRISPVGQPPDGRYFRVVGAHVDAAFNEGAVSRVIRAAIVRDGSVIRAGEVLTNRSVS